MEPTAYIDVPHMPYINSFQISEKKIAPMVLLGVVTPGRPLCFRVVISPCVVRLGHSFVVFRSIVATQEISFEYRAVTLLQTNKPKWTLHKENRRHLMEQETFVRSLQKYSFTRP